ncbi:unnamed protein product, partial [Trichobilharzia szidati]
SIRDWSLFGSSCFLAFVESGVSQGLPNPEVIIALGKSGIHILNPSSNECYQNFAYEDVASTR